MNSSAEIETETAPSRVAPTSKKRGTQPQLLSRLFQWKSILVPVDYRESSATALQCAAELAAMSGAKLTVLNIVSGGRESLYNEQGVRITAAESRQLAQKKLTTWLKTIALPAKVKSEPLVRWGQPVDEVIIATAHRWNIDLIVMSGHARHFWQRLFDVKTTSRVVRYAPCDVYYACHNARLPRLTKTPRPSTTRK
jgi:nucleotide-binding universal stress UspA family protein